MYKNKNILYPIISLLTVVIQGTIFVSAKVLINERLPLVEILLCRFILAYSCIWIISHGKLWANCPKDEELWLDFSGRHAVFHFPESRRRR